METDEVMRDQVYRLRRAKDLMRVGYGDVRPPAGRRRAVRIPTWSGAIRCRKGLEPVMMNSVDTTKPAMDQIIEHVQDGWKYIKVKTLLSPV